MPIPASSEPIVRPGNYTENGREYHGYHRGKYMFPCDEVSTNQFSGGLDGKEGKANSAAIRKKWIAWISTINFSPWQGMAIYTQPPLYKRKTIADHEYWIWERELGFGPLIWQSESSSVQREKEGHN